MSKRRDWQQNNQRLTRDEVGAKCTALAEVEGMAKNFERELDLALIDSTLAHPLLDEKGRRQLLSSRAWILETPQRQLPSLWRKKYKLWERTLRMKAAGTYTGPTPGAAAARKRQHQLRAARMEETRPKLAAFLKDPSLLPKKPPQKGFS